MMKNLKIVKPIESSRMQWNKKKLSNFQKDYTMKPINSKLQESKWLKPSRTRFWRSALSNHKSTRWLDSSDITGTIDLPLKTTSPLKSLRISQSGHKHQMPTKQCRNQSSNPVSIQTGNQASPNQQKNCLRIKRVRSVESRSNLLTYQEL